MIDDTLPLIIRPMIASDYPFILSNFTRELHKTKPYNFIPNGIFFPYYTNLLNNILSTAQVSVSVLEDNPGNDQNPGDIASYLIWKDYGKDNVIVYWGGTKAIFRRLGAMKSLLELQDYKNKNIICAHMFNMFSKLKDDYNLIYDPTVLENV